MKLIKIQKKVELYNLKLLYGAALVVEVNDKLNKTIKNVNKTVSIFTNKKLIKTITLLKFLLSIVQVIVFVRLFNFSKGFSLDIKKVKKLLYSSILRNLFEVFCKLL